MNMGSYLLWIHWLSKHSIGILPAEYNSGKRGDKSSSSKLDATNLILCLRQICETLTFEASQESSPAPSGLAAASSSQSLKSGKKINQIFMQKEAQKPNIEQAEAEQTKSKSDLAPKAASSAARSWGRSSHHHQTARSADLALARSCAAKRRQGWWLIRQHGPPRDGEICRRAARSGASWAA
jgi:hypothetical protein